MTVKELINKLSQCDPNVPVIIEYTDATDYLYFHHVGDEYNTITERDGVIVDSVDNGNPYDLDTIDSKAVVINLDEGNAFYGLG